MCRIFRHSGDLSIVLFAVRQTTDNVQQQVMNDLGPLGDGSFFARPKGTKEREEIAQTDHYLTWQCGLGQRDVGCEL